MLGIIPIAYRWLALALLAVALVGFGWVKGAQHVERKFEAYKAEQMAQAAIELSKRLAKQTELQRKNEGIANDLQKAKMARAADAVATAGKLRDFHATLDSATRADASACPRTDDPRPAILSECASALRTMDIEIKELAGKAVGLQEYAKLCLVR